MTTTVTPTQVYAAFYPTAVTLPDKSVWYRCKVYLTDVGVVVYRQAPTPGHDAVPALVAALNYAGLARPVGEIATGYYLPTADGLVVLTGGGGCGCGNPLKGWQPEWASSLSPWPGL